MAYSGSDGDSLGRLIEQLPPISKDEFRHLLALASLRYPSA